MNGNEALAALSAGITVKYREIGTVHWLQAKTLSAQEILQGAMRIGGKTVLIEFTWVGPARTSGIRSFEAKFGTPEHWIRFDESKNRYVCDYNSIDHTLLIRQARWEAWQAAIESQGEENGR